MSEIARTELEVWRLAHKVGAEFAQRFDDPVIPQHFRDGIATYRDYIEQVVAKAGFQAPGPNDSIQDNPWPKADAYAIYTAWLQTGERSGKAVWEAIEAAYDAGKATSAGGES